ncbi:putative ribonuclease H-like domain-containing protein [Tanacetum coccineum]
MKLSYGTEDWGMSTSKISTSWLKAIWLGCKKIEERTVREPLELLHMDLFGPVSVESINKKKYCLVVTDDCSKFSWVFFLAYKDETYDMLHDLIVGLENRLRHKVKTIRCDNETEFKNQLLNEFCAKKGIKREFSIARTPQQNGVAERKNRTLIEAARTMLADSLLPIQFWAEAVNTACYVLNRVLVTKPQMKTPYEILMGRSPNISFMRPFGCPLTILNTLDHLGKFDGKSEEGYLLGYSTNSKGFRVYNRVTRKVQDCLHVNFLENQENQKGKGPDWMFDLDLLTPSMNYIPVRKENYADSKEQGITCDDAEDLDDQQFIVHTTQPMPPEERTAAKEVKLSSEDQALHDELVSLMHQESLAKAHNDDQRIAFEEEKRRISIAKGKEHVDSTFTLSTANTPPQSTGNTPTDSDDDTPTDGVFSTNSFDAEEGGVADYNNLDPTIDVPSTPTLRIHKIHPQSQIIGKSTAGVQTRRKLQDSTSNQHQALLSFIYKQNRTNHKDQQTCLFACFLSQEEPKKVSQALADESWVEAMQEELLQFKLQEVWVLCDLPEGKRVIGTKWVFRNKRDERGTIIKNKARLVAQGYRQEEGVDYDEVLHQLPELKATTLFGISIFHGLHCLQRWMSRVPFLYGIITEALYGRASSPKSMVYERLSTFLLKHGIIGERAIDKNSVYYEDREDIHIGYRFMLYEYSSLDLPSSSMVYDWLSHVLNLLQGPAHTCFAVCLVCKDFKSSKSFHLHAVKRIFSTSKLNQLGLGLWYPKDSPFHLEAFSDSDYAGDNHDRRSTSGGCQYLGRRLVSWQCKKQTIVAISSTEARNSCCSCKLLCSATIEILTYYLMLKMELIAFLASLFGIRSEILATEGRLAQGSQLNSAAHSNVLASVQGTAAYQGTASIPKSPNDYTPTDASLKIWWDDGTFRSICFKQEPVVKHHAFWVEGQNLKKQKRRRKKQKKKVSFTSNWGGRNRKKGTLSEEHYVQEEDTAHPFFDDIVDKDAAVNPDLERKSDETEEVNIEEKEASNVKSGETENWDLETTQSTADREHLKAAEVLVAISRPRGLSIPGPIQSQPQQPTQGTDTQGELLEIIQSEWDMQKKKEKRYPLQESDDKDARSWQEVADETETSHYFDTSCSFLWTMKMVTILKHMLASPEQTATDKEVSVQDTSKQIVYKILLKRYEIGASTA